MKAKLFVGLLTALVLMSGAFAAELGMNYYHETMMRNGFHYIDRNPSQVSQDLDHIKTLTSNVKLYMNPLTAGNQDWVSQINDIAKQKGMHTVVVMNTEDRELSDSNWQEYKAKAMDACRYFSGKSDEFIVGNEVTLHSKWSRPEIKNRMVELIDECKKSFSGPVSYEAFWYEKDAWKGYTGRIYFNLYEQLENYKTNVNEMDSSFGANAYVGEFGEDFSDEGTKRDANWQANQVKERWNTLQQTDSPVVYLFTYREPSEGGFGVLSPTGAPLPAWNVFGSIPAPSPSPTPAPAPSTILPDIKDLKATCTVEGSSCTPKSDTTSGVCRTIIFSTQNGDIKIFACEKENNNVEVYRQQEPASTVYTACLDKGCVSNLNGFAKFTPQSVTPAPTPSPSPNTTLPPTQETSNPTPSSSSGSSGGGSSSSDSEQIITENDKNTTDKEKNNSISVNQIIGLNNNSDVVENSVGFGTTLGITGGIIGANEKIQHRLMLILGLVFAIVAIGSFMTPFSRLN